MKLVYHTLLPLFFPALLVGIFFFRLFYPQPQIFMIPDFGESDVLHLNLPLKYILSTSLKNHEWPLWTPYLANGFPVLAEGQIGTFYLPNLLLFRFLPLILAYNLSLVISYLLASFGTFLFARKIGLSRTSAFFASFIFTFSGFLAVHLNHFNLIQAASLLPLIFYSALLIWQKPKLKYSILFAFFLSQQIFTGHFYIVFITLLGLFLFLIFYCCVSTTKITSRCILSLLSSLIIGVGLSGIQLFPTIELWQLSARAGGLDFDTVTDYPYPIKHLVTFIAPYFFGSPANGTYPSFSSEWGIFWENTAYVGIIPLILAAGSIFFLKDRLVKTFLLILSVSLFLVLGRNSPLYFIFSFPPFNFFRVPSKFLLLVTFSLSILAAISLEVIKSQFHAIARFCDKRKICYLPILVILLFILIFDEYRFSYNYPPATPAEMWISPPEITNLIPQNSKIASLAAPYLWNKVFKKEGWRDFAPYVYFKNSLYPNFNVFSSLPTVDINTGGLIPRRLSLFTGNIKNIEVDEEKKEASVSSALANTLSLAATNYIISPYKMNHRFFALKNKVTAPPPLKLDPYLIYENKRALPRSYLSYNNIEIDTLEEFNATLADDNFLSRQTILVEESDLRIGNSANAIKPVKIVSEDPIEVVIAATSDNPATLVLSDTNYPGWQAYLDGAPVKIHNVNLVQRGVYFPKGQHKVKFIFQSPSFALGKKITIFSSLIVFAVMFLSVSAFPRKASGIGRRKRGLYNKGNNLKTKVNNWRGLACL